MNGTGKTRSTFARELEQRNTDPQGRQWLYVPYDQLSDEIGPLSREDPNELGIVLIESPWKAAQRPYHKQKLALVLANMRHFALEQAARGVAIDYRVANGDYCSELLSLAENKGGLRCMLPAERELRQDLTPLARQGLLEFVPHEGWLSSEEDFEASQNEQPPWRMEAFYRFVRRSTGWLMDERGKPLGGQFSFDAQNREPWKGDPPAAQPPEFVPDAITEEVVALVEQVFAKHPGELDLASLPATREQASSLWQWVKEECLPLFGPYEDAMSSKSRTLFHSRVSSLVHLHRLLPRKLVEETCKLDIELRCKEGFIRQLLGWREFVRHVHVKTDGFRQPPKRRPASESGANPSFLGAEEKLPAAYWGAKSGLACLDQVVQSVWEEGYSHHITRLMILSNLATLLDVSPRELTDWFWVAYTDAYDWVVEPNVLAMGTFGTGDLMTTKPYISGSAYIHRMSDYCKGCAFDPKKDCPITSLYWSFLQRHRDKLDMNPRMRMPFASLRKRADAKCAQDRRTFDFVREKLGAGEPLSPGNMRECHAQ